MNISKIIKLNASDLAECLTIDDIKHINRMQTLYRQCEKHFIRIDRDTKFSKESEEQLISLYNQMGSSMKSICESEPRLNVFTFTASSSERGEATRIVAKLRDQKTDRLEFVYYIQQAYELLFNLAFHAMDASDWNYFIKKTPISYPVQNYAIHKLPNVDKHVENSVMCVMLRGALLPSMILSKEIQEYSSTGYVTPFSLFSIKRNEECNENNMEYSLDLGRSYFDPEFLDGKDLIFADPMNATGGSFITILNYLKEVGVKPKSIKFINVVSSLKGALRVVRTFDEVEVYTLWMDPVINEKAYILPGLGDAGDRINGVEDEAYSRGIIQLISDYGLNIAQLYKNQIHQIEKTVLNSKWGQDNE